jgi:hypothetical protein
VDGYGRYHNGWFVGLGVRSDDRISHEVGRTRRN